MSLQGGILAWLGRFLVLRLPGPEGRKGVQEGGRMLNGGAKKASLLKALRVALCIWFLSQATLRSVLPLKNFAGNM